MKKLVLIIALYLTVSPLCRAQSAKKINHPAMAMADMSVNDLLKAVKNQANDVMKLEVIKRAVTNNTDGILVAQELRLLNQFATDDAKLECAKFLYPWCTDYKNYDKIQYNMSTPAGQAAIKKFIAGKGAK